MKTETYRQNVEIMTKNLVSHNETKQYKFPTHRQTPCLRRTKNLSLISQPNSLFQIEKILKSENRNLKDQNHLLLVEINKLRTTNKKYKNIDQVQRLELQQLEEECQAQRRRAD